jgi:hypothetical protein
MTKWRKIKEARYLDRGQASAFYGAGRRSIGPLMVTRDLSPMPASMGSITNQPSRSPFRNFGRPRLKTFCATS